MQIQTAAPHDAQRLRNFESYDDSKHMALVTLATEVSKNYIRKLEKSGLIM